MSDAAPEESPDQNSCVTADDLSSFTSDSAMMIAYERALETERGEDAFFRDPFARTLAGEKGEGLSSRFEAGAPHFGFGDWPQFHKTWTVVRTKFIDDHLERLASTDCGLQMVNLGAGMDTRLWRLPCCSNFTKAFEVDLAVITSRKERFFKAQLGVEPLCAMAAVTADLLDAAALADGLAQAGHDTSAASVFLAEGLVMYLGDKTPALVSAVSAVAARGSTFIINFMGSDPEVGSPPGTASQEEMRAMLEVAGWSDLRFNLFGDDVLNYGRYKEGHPPNRCFSFVVCTKA